MKVRYLGHGAFLIDFKGTNLLIDPFISGNPINKTVKIEEIEADYILLTHGHSDHVADVEAIANRTKAKIISNFEIVNWFKEKGLAGHAMNHGGKFKFDFGTVKYVSAIHTSSMPDGSYGGNPGGFVIWNESNCIYIAGDTALTMDMKLIPMLCPKLDLAILPVGDNFTMGYEEALIASDFVACNEIVACHYDTMEILKVDKALIANEFEMKGKNITFLEIGETKIVNG